MNRNKWLYSLQKKEKLISQCRQNGGITVTEAEIEGVGEIEAAKGCLLRTAEYQLLPTTEGSLQVELHRRLVTIDVPAQLELNTGVNLYKNRIQEIYTAAKEEGHTWHLQPGTEEIELEEMKRINQRLLAIDDDSTTWEWTWVTTGAIIITTGVAVALWHKRNIFHAKKRDTLPDKETTEITTAATEPGVVYRLAPSEVLQLKEANIGTTAANPI